MFSDYIQQKLGFYVYALLDPEDGRPFYIGKGQENRVFTHAENAKVEMDVVSEKIETIQRIHARGKNVEHVIIRHGLDEATALHVESALIDFCRHVIDLSTTNLVLGHGSEDIGIMTSDEIITKYEASPLTPMGSDCVIINISQTYRRAQGPAALYNATKKAWVIGSDRNNLKYVLAAYRGFIVEVFEIEGDWYGIPSVTNKGEPTTRWGFEGKVADESVRALYVNKTFIRRRGAANPVVRQLPLVEDRTDV
jgi:hypothetical protein